MGDGDCVCVEQVETLGVFEGLWAFEKVENRDGVERADAEERTEPEVGGDWEAPTRAPTPLLREPV